MVSAVIGFTSILRKIIVVLGLLLGIIMVYGTLSDNSPIGNIVVGTIFFAILIYIFYSGVSFIERFLIGYENKGGEDNIVPIKIFMIIAAIPIGVIWFIFASIMSIIFKEEIGELPKRTRVKVKVVEMDGVYRIVSVYNNSLWYADIISDNSGGYRITDPDNHSQYYGTLKYLSEQGFYEVKDNNGYLKFILSENEFNNSFGFNIWWYE